MAPSIIRPTSLGHLSRVIGFRLADAPPGEYDLRDELSGTSIERHESFMVAPPFGLAAPAAAADAAETTVEAADEGGAEPADESGPTSAPDSVPEESSPAPPTEPEAEPAGMAGDK
jgi:uncharacterized membrane protein